MGSCIMPNAEKITIYLDDGTTEEHFDFSALISRPGGTAVRGAIRPKRPLIALVTFLGTNREYLESVLIGLDERPIRLPIGPSERGPAGNF